MTLDHDQPDWIPAPDARPIADRLDLDDVDTLREVTHEVRGAILRRLKDPRTVAELAASMDVPVTRLYHHVNRLHDLDLIQVVSTRQVAAVTERRYQVVARTFGFDPEKMESLDHRELAVALGGLFDVAKLGFQRMVESGALEQHDADDMGTLSLAERSLSVERHRELVRRLSELVEEFESDRDMDAPDAISATILIAAFPEAR